MSYNEELARVITTSTAIKAALPNTAVAAPSRCSWWFYWTSAVDYSDDEAHDDMDWLPWFVAQMKKSSDAIGMRLLGKLYIYLGDTRR
jgi:Glycoside hydrolase family 44